MDHTKIAEQDEESDDSTTSSVAHIPMPTGSPPGYSSGLANEHGVVVCQTREPGHAHLTKQSGESKTMYSSAPALRDLILESAAFVPKNVKTPRIDVPELETYSKQMFPGEDNAIEEQQDILQRKVRLNIAPSVDRD